MQFYKYPQTDLNQQNLDWLVHAVKDLQEREIESSAGIQVITSASQMTDHDVVYIYKGSEPGYNTDHYYYWDSGTNAWTDGGAFGFDSSLLPISIANGGTGSTTASAARSALGITPGNIGAASSSWFTNGLSIARGGTGATNAADARDNLEITPANIGAVDSSVFDSGLAVSMGGTGAVTVAGAKTNLGIVTPNKYVTSSGTTNGWEWEQWSDGDVDMFKRVQVLTSCTSQWSTNIPFFSTNDQADGGAYPFTFSEQPVVAIEVEGGGATLAGGYIYANGTTTTAPKVSGWRPTSAGSVTLIVGFHVHGKTT